MRPKTKAARRDAVRKKRKQRSPAGRFVFTVIKMVLIFLIALTCAVAGVLGGAVYGYIKTAQPIRDEQLKITILPTYIYDSKSNQIAKLTGKENKNTELVYDKDIPEYLKQALVAIEDERFYNHPGIDLEGFIRAIKNKILNPSSKMQGGSTITMQVVRNITGKFDVTLQRKVQEWWNALQLEKRLTKREILELYMNIIAMGHGSYGVQSASKTYFGKNVWDLSLAESALLAGITNRPVTYDPFTEKGRTNAKKRQELILQKMLELGNIDEKQYEQAKNEELKYAVPGEGFTATSAQSYFVDKVVSDVTQDLMTVRGMSKEMALTTIYNYGLKIYTTQDSDIQKAMDEVFTDDKYFPLINTEAKKMQEHPQASMVAIDPHTGQVKALYGGYGVKEASNTLNRATQINRQPGSSIKPIAVYGPAIDLRLITAATVIDDVPVYMMTTGPDKDKPYPQNYDGLYGGLTSIRNAIKASINVVAAKVWRDYLGPDRSVDYLKKAGIDRVDEKYVSLAMGGLHKGVNTFQMAAAYVPFVNKGVYFEPITYTKVLDSSGRVLLEKKTKYNTVYDETSAFIMTDMLKEVVLPRGNSPYPHSGTATLCTLQGQGGNNMPVAGKTGTTSENIDKWFVGYTPYFVAATWYGYDNKYTSKPPIKLTKAEYKQAQIIWKAVMQKIHKDLPVIDFPQPSGLVKKRISIYSGKIATDLCAKDPRGDATRDEYFIKGTEPKDFDDVHVTAKVCTAHRDIWGRFLLAGPNCPANTILEGVFIQREVPYVPIKPDDKYPGDWLYELPAGEYCTVHGGSAQTAP